MVFSCFSGPAMNGQAFSDTCSESRLCTPTASAGDFFLILATQFRDAVAQSAVATGKTHVVAKMAFAALLNLELMTFYSANWHKLTWTVRPCVQRLRYTTFTKRLLEFVPTASNEPWLCQGNPASNGGFRGDRPRFSGRNRQKNIQEKLFQRSKMGRIRLDNLSLKEFWIAEECEGLKREHFNLSTFHETTFTESKLFDPR